jgi:PiT family inorganic phosphate transporter
MGLLLTVLFVALVFEYINGFHDTANSIATVVSTKVLHPRQAIFLATVTNLLGALAGTAVAKTITSGLVDSKFVGKETIVCALLGGIVWNLITWWFGLPSSSSHALVGGLCGATLASAQGDWAAIIWQKTVPDAPWWKFGGILYKVVVPMVLSPLIGLIAGFLMMSLIYLLIQRMRPSLIGSVFGTGQLLSSAFMGWSHGSNDAQKTMGIMTLALVQATQAGTLEGIPDLFSFLKIQGAPGQDVVPLWIKMVCAMVMAAGTAAGGWRIIKTMGHKMVKMRPVHGFAAETTAASVLSVAAHFGMPVSTTHAITTSIMGVGCAKRFSALNLNVVHRILWAWVLTLPITALLGWLAQRIWTLAFA